MRWKRPRPQDSPDEEKKKEAFARRLRSLI